MLKSILLVDDNRVEVLHDGLSALAKEHGLEFHYKETLKRFKEYLKALSPGEKVLLVSDTRLSAFTHIVADYLAIEPEEELKAAIEAFLLYTKDEYALENHGEIDGRIYDLKPLYIGRYHLSQASEITAAVEGYLTKVGLNPSS